MEGYSINDINRMWKNVSRRMEVPSEGTSVWENAEAREARRRDMSTASHGERGPGVWMLLAALAAALVLSGEPEASCVPSPSQRAGHDGLGRWRF